MHTKVINLYGGPGTGKSTFSSLLYSTMKLKHMDVELVREYVKDWVWEGRTPSKWDQIYIAGKQTHKEAILYNKVKYIITDSPYMLGAFYEMKFTKQDTVLSALLRFRSFAENNDVKYVDVLLPRPEKYQSKGRYQSKKQAIKLDEELREFLHNNVFDFVELPANLNQKQRINFVLKLLK